VKHGDIIKESEPRGIGNTYSLAGKQKPSTLYETLTVHTTPIASKVGL